jgi:hypothetical protein
VPPQASPPGRDLRSQQGYQNIPQSTIAKGSINNERLLYAQKDLCLPTMSGVNTLFGLLLSASNLYSGQPKPSC